MQLEPDPVINLSGYWAGKVPDYLKGLLV